MRNPMRTIALVSVGLLLLCSGPAYGDGGGLEPRPQCPDDPAIPPTGSQIIEGQFIAILDEICYDRKNLKYLDCEDPPKSGKKKPRYVVHVEMYMPVASAFGHTRYRTRLFYLGKRKCQKEECADWTICDWTSDRILKAYRKEPCEENVPEAMGLEGNAAIQSINITSCDPMMGVMRGRVYIGVWQNPAAKK